MSTIFPRITHTLKRLGSQPSLEEIDVGVSHICPRNGDQTEPLSSDIMSPFLPTPTATVHLTTRLVKSSDNVHR
ncbi:hypothetical protein Cob_v004756 [Colletotrichum orbiculare MAFF 240422]|uniref:Uncharacterized protein n=1 Tax=Colletotrichum orbiculare (strain 104-T / ATCC 96160 / CBS 514.97 / LARS 414 / MAFF 240422) TaxID=1213857 RepID=A0A484FVE0_COLOR|nr:hypothetical protein Cob_v004756 [Colletotrichum orbiculare MAFF 240422]